MVTSKQIVLAARPVGVPRDSDFGVVSVDVPRPGEGQVLLRVIYLSLDPYMRGRMSAAKSYAASAQIGEVMMGATVCEVLESRAEGFESGDLVLSYSGWQTHALEDARTIRRLDASVAPVSTALGVLGMPGFTAYVGLRVLGKPTPGETVAVAAATGPVGSAVGQIARLMGARAVGIAGGHAKCVALLEEFGFDAAIDHRSARFADDLRESVPDGIDVYFENVGGHVSREVFTHLNTYARIPLCGLVADYNATGVNQGPDRLPGFMRMALTKSLTIRGFIQTEFADEFYDDFLEDMSGWLATGSVRYREDIVSGIESAPAAFRGMLEGHNFGKLIVQVGAHG